jgi:hypothetical protein
MMMAMNSKEIYVAEEVYCRYINGHMEFIFLKTGTTFCVASIHRLNHNHGNRGKKVQLI